MNRVHKTKGMLHVAAYLSVFTVLLILAFFPCAGCKKAQVTGTEKPKDKLVEIITPRKGSMQPVISFTGTLIPENEVDLYSKMPGRIASVMVKEGDYVREGQLLVQLEDSEYVAQVRQIEANLAAARTQLSQAQAGYGLQDAQVDIGIDQSIHGKMQATLGSEQARLNLEDAKNDLARMQLLFDRGAISKDQLENVQLRYDVAVKQYEHSISMMKQADESVKLARANIAMKQIKRDDIAKGEAQIEALSASLDMARTTLNNCRIVAPFSGVITLKTAEKGEVVTGAPTGTPLLRLVDNGTINLEGEIGEEKIQEVKVGSSVEMTADAIPGKIFRGLVSTIIPSADLKTKAFRIKVAVPNQAGELNAGMFARAHILLTPCLGLLVPRPCLIKGGSAEQAKVVEKKNQPEKGPELEETGESFFLFIQEGNRAKKVAVVIGNLNEKEAVVTDGIDDKSRVISVGQENLQDNDVITVVRGM